MSTSYALFDEMDPIPTSRRRPGPRLNRMSLPYAVGSDTSKAAADKARWSAGAVGEQIYQHIMRCGPCGATDKEIERVLGIQRATICARRKGLAGRIQDSGQRRDGCAVWTVVVPC